jgi:hypothetical protein
MFRRALVLSLIAWMSLGASFLGARIQPAP